MVPTYLIAAEQDFSGQQCCGVVSPLAVLSFGGESASMAEWLISWCGASISATSSGEETGTGGPRVEPCLGYVVGHPQRMLLFDTGLVLARIS